MKKRNRVTSAGFTLLEILLAMTLFVSLIPVFFQVFVSSSRQMQNMDTDIAYQLARSGLENLNETVRQDWWDNIPVGAGAPGMLLVPGEYDGDMIEMNEVEFQPSYVVENVDGRDYRRVTMKVEY